ncbi:MAG: PEP-CTERM sorting domain-containing protein [Armatimonadetes bacterium]|nr:PEP-CTERM sorting domain-containing protein [Armatimonadota bacterium]
MKMILRSISAVTPLLLLGVAQAQNSRFYFGYGDAATAELNGHSVGEEIPTDRGFRVLPGGHFKLQIWVEKLLGGAEDFTSLLSTHVAYDRAIVNNAEVIPESALMHRKLSYGGATLQSSLSNMARFASWDPLTDLPADRNNDGIQDINPLVGAARLRGVFSTDRFVTTERRAGFGGGWLALDADGRNTFFKLGPVGSKVHLFDFEMKNTLALYDIYGDDGLETGLALTPKTTANFQSGNHSAVRAFGDDTSLGSQLIVQGVPEPSSILALSLGGLVLLRRRK